MELPVEVYRKAGEIVTLSRVAITGAIVGDLAVASEEESYSWKRFYAAGFVAILDKIDGWLVRLHPNGPTPEGAQLDEESDKVITGVTEATLAIKHNDSFAATSVVIDLMRDSIVRKKRDELRERGLDAKARKLGKYKTGWKNITNTFALSPIAEKHPKIIKAMRVGEMALTLASGIDIIRSANHAISEQDFLEQKAKTE